MQNQIVYLTSNGGSNTWNAPDFGTAENPSTGVLIFHNSNTNAELKNIHGYFNGIIITDKLTHINGNAVINGAVMILNANNNNIGNGDDNVNYSQDALDQLPLNLYSIVSWKDISNS